MSKKQHKAAAPSRDLYQAVTDRIVAALEAGTKPALQRPRPRPRPTASSVGAGTSIPKCSRSK
jgi:antirestriction protein ArdC